MALSKEEFIQLKAGLNLANINKFGPGDIALFLQTLVSALLLGETGNLSTVQKAFVRCTLVQYFVHLYCAYHKVLVDNAEDTHRRAIQAITHLYDWSSGSIGRLGQRLEKLNADLATKIDYCEVGLENARTLQRWLAEVAGPKLGNDDEIHSEGNAESLDKLEADLQVVWQAIDFEDHIPVGQQQKTAGIFAKLAEVMPVSRCMHRLERYETHTLLDEFNALPSHKFWTIPIDFYSIHRRAYDVLIYPDTE
ncbi:hypothetical protein B0T17DRAFT_658106 [Bombardia bombarda]|uniref:Uncharacterized protein n=1 Tax=Bombardia bombarda TaxID=252184 RepID=A0AA39WBM2_9PEZI|nr:hypothetical protein B0T17DRAFT_658106 [Bombardia bombarda]